MTNELSTKLGITLERASELKDIYSERFRNFDGNKTTSDYIKTVLDDQLLPEELAYVMFNIGRYG